MERPVISFITDFGPESAPAICRGVMLGIARDAHIVDISHSVRKYAIRDGAYLLWSAVRSMPVGTVHVVVIDPGVGTARRGIAIRTARGDVLVGPDNGVLMPAADVLGGIAEVRELENPAFMLDRISATFHGRDVFAPMGAHLAAGRPFDAVGRRLDAESLVQLSFPRPTARGGDLETTVLFIDSFGNVRLSGVPEDLAGAAGALRSGREFEVTFGGNGHATIVERVPWATTFGERPLGEALLYENSFGGLALADNQGNHAARLGIEPGLDVRIRPA